MQINKIELKNFRQYKELTLEFPLGLTGFVGKNGAGKSTIFEAIANAFYGNFDTNKSLVKNDKAFPRDNMSVTLYFNDKGNDYKIIRDYRGKSLTPKADLFKDGNHIVTGSEEVSREIRKIIKIDFTNFKNSFFARQKEVTALLALGAKERQKALRKMLGLERMDKLEAKVKNEIKEQSYDVRAKEETLLPENEIKEMMLSEKKLTKELVNEETELEKLSTEVEESEKEYEKIKLKLKKLESVKKTNDSLKTEITLTNNNISNAEKNIKKTESELQKLREEVKEYNSLIPSKEKYEKFSTEIEKLQTEELKFKEKTNLEKRIRDNEEKISKENKKNSEQKEKLKEFSGIDEKLKEITKKEKDVKNEIQKIKKHQNTLNKLIGSLGDRFKEKKVHLDEIIEIGRDSNCPTCERPLEDHYDALVDKYKKEIKKLKTELEEAELEENELFETLQGKENELDKLNEEKLHQEKRAERKKALENKIADIRENIKDLKKESEEFMTALSKIGKIKFDKENLKNIKAEQKELAGAYKRCLSLSKKSEEIPPKTDEKKRLKSKLKLLRAELKAFTNDLNKLSFDEKLYEKTNVLRERKEKALNLLRERLYEKREEISMIRTELKRIDNKLSENEKLKKKIKRLRNEIELFDKLAKTVAVIKEKITSRELPQISKGASQLFSKITRGRYFNLKIDADFNFKVSRDDKEVDLITLSGGEKDLAGLCLRIAISERISKLAGRSNMGFLALDEVFGSLDEGRREELLQALHVISGQFRQIFVVSHNQDVQEEFPARIVVAKRGNFSEAEVVLA